MDNIADTDAKINGTGAWTQEDEGRLDERFGVTAASTHAHAPSSPTVPIIVAAPEPEAASRGELSAPSAASSPAVGAPARTPAAPATAESAPIRYVAWERVWVDYGTPGSWVYVVIEVPALDPNLWPHFRVPDKREPDSPDWFFVEVFTGVSAERVAKAWTKDNTNPALEEAKRGLAAALSGCALPLKTDGAVGLDRFRGEVIRARVAQGNLPWLFLTAPKTDVERARTLLRDVWDGHLFRFGAEPGGLRGVPALVLPKEGKLGLEILDEEVLMRGIIIRSMRCASVVARAKVPSQPLVLDLIGFADPAAPIIERVVRVPTMRPDGTICDVAGYDHQSRTWYAPEVKLEAIPEEPTAEDVAAVKAVLEAPFAEFPFVGEQDRTAYYAAVLEPFVRPMIRGPVPLHALDAPPNAQGSGKTTLAKCVRALVTGERDATVTSLGRREEETEKRVYSILRTGAAVVVVDNVMRTVDSETLAQLATSERFQARLLGVSEAPSLPQVAKWIMTMNAAKLSRDLARRTVLVRLDPKCDKAWERSGPAPGTTWRIDDVLGYVLEHRAEMIRACLVLARAWVIAGRPKDAELVRGSFEGWAHTVGGILHHAGYRGLMAALRASDERDPDAEDFGLLLLAWSVEQPNMMLTAVALGEIAKRHDLFSDRISKFSSGVGLGKRMAAILKPVLGKPIGGKGLKIIVAEGVVLGGCRAYTYVPVEASPSAPAP
ncbi:MAG: hypothetical protein IT384_29195 [Deltaproteobacteria bacterium]|nr:hypothetical protein [Deltaproteobacteria bacterium]